MLNSVKKMTHFNTLELFSLSATATLFSKKYDTIRYDKHSNGKLLCINGHTWTLADWHFPKMIDRARQKA